jgi:hypothetical protein
LGAWEDGAEGNVRTKKEGRDKNEEKKCLHEDVPLLHNSVKTVNTMMGRGREEIVGGEKCIKKFG